MVDLVGQGVGGYHVEHLHLSRNQTIGFHYVVNYLTAKRHRLIKVGTQKQDIPCYYFYTGCGWDE